MKEKKHSFVTGRSHFVLNQKVQKFSDRRTKRNRERGTKKRNAIDDSRDE